MHKLIKYGLYGQGLIAVDRPAMIKRYNACLEDIGLTPTSLKKFRIDGWGWSPEIAEEQRDDFYLSHNGPANPYAIILSPAQEHKPIYFPYHSFDRFLLNTVYNHARSQLADLTTETAVWIDVDQEISAYDAPQDLLMVDSIQLKFHTVNRIMQAAVSQRKLVHDFYNTPGAWCDRELHENIIESCTHNGDLRFRSLDIPEIPFMGVRSFYTLAQGGVFVFRDLPGGRPILICETGHGDRQIAQAMGYDEYTLDEPDLLPRLFTEDLVELDLDFYRSNRGLLRRKLECMYADAMSVSEPDADIQALKLGRKKLQVLKLRALGLLGPEHLELERLMKKLQKGKKVHPRDLSDSLRLLLTRPAANLTDESTKYALWQLLNRLSSIDMVQLYEFDKADFFRRYKVWSKSKQDWAVDYIRREYFGIN